MKKNAELSPARLSTIDASVAARPLIRKIDSGSTGLGCRISLMIRAASSTAAAASSPIVWADPHPLSGALTSA
jgi:hypothetical protein